MQWVMENTPEKITRENELLIQQAIVLITEKLANLLDEPKPTLLHCIRVGTKLYNLWYSLPITLGGYLHDTVEDSDVTIKQIEEQFGPETAKIVSANTVNDDLPKSEKKKEVVDRCIATGKDATIVMATEILDGLKYYKKTENHTQLANKIQKAQIFLEKVPYDDRVFDELREFVESHSQLHTPPSH